MHDHIHNHTHEHNAAGKPAARQLLRFMHEHNEAHADELARLAGSLVGEGHGEEAALVREGLASIQAGNAKVAEALAQLEAGQED